MLLARGRDTQALFGGSDVVDLGTARIDQGIQVPEPAVTYGARTRDRTELWSAGFAYRAQWQRRGDFAFGIQQENYTKDVVSPTVPEEHFTDHPLRIFGTGALSLTERVTAYAGYTQGLEDSGAAASSAENRGAILPDARTWQADAGIRYLPTPGETDRGRFRN
jgi:iron complex outermembrane receptor protein